MGGGFSGYRAGGPAGSAVYGGLGTETHSQTRPEGEGRHRDYEQHV